MEVQEGKGESGDVWGLKEGGRDETGRERGIYSVSERSHLPLPLVLL